MKIKKCCVCLAETKYKYCSIKCKIDAQLAKRKTKKWHKQRGITKVKLDKTWSTRVKERDGKCLYCGKNEYLNAHHIFSRHNLTVRWLMENGITLCAGCHTFSDKFSAHKTPTEFTYWLATIIGDEALQSLRIKAHGINDKPLEYWHDYLNRGDRQ